MDNAQSLSTSTLVLITLGILILVIGTMMIIKFMNTDPIESCENRNGQCFSTPCKEQTPPLLHLGLDKGGCGEGQYCCLAIGTQTT